MGRLPQVDHATQHHQGVEVQEIHHSPIAPPDEDLYKPPPGYQPPPPPAATRPEAQPFPPVQDQTAEPFPPNQHIPIQQGIPVIPAQDNKAWKSNLFDCMKDPQNGT